MKKLYVALGLGVAFAASFAIPQVRATSTSAYKQLVSIVSAAEPAYSDGSSGALSLNVGGGLRVTQRPRSVAYGSSPTAIAAAARGETVADLEGRPYVNPAHPKAINCYLAASTATTSTQITGCELVAGQSIYVTSVTLSGDAASTTSNPATLQSGTSTGCTGPHVLFSCHHAAVSSCTATFPQPIKATVAEGLCLLDGVTGTKTATVTGYLAP